MIVLAGATTALSIVKSLIAKQRPNTITPASLVKAPAA
jgi:hypothetical protein